MKVDSLMPLLIVTPIMLLLALGIIMFVLRYQRRMLIHQEKLRRLQENKQRQLLAATLKAQEEERRRVARDLHDEVGSMLALVKLNLHQLIAENRPGATTVSLGKETKALLQEAIGSVRRISHDLMPVVLEKMGLPQALEAMRRALPANSGTTMVLACNENRRVNPKLELLLYRTVQELLNNTLKHAEASLIHVSLTFSEDEVMVQYSDNGKGFDYENVMKAQEQGSSSIGLMNMQARVALANGTLSIQSEPGQGTKAEIKITIS
ncbi:MAG: sensor histidine kinase [Hymenobacteraceae bacterium]|nr:sensor histidine kinase [Hymenobacteraceae bacterium]MDX5482483.1 sensor histidine kinase [Hymenobacteraceae bacterium]